MKKKCVFTFLFFFLTSLIVNGQNKVVPILDYANQVMYYDTLNNNISSLENVKPEFKNKTQFTGGLKAMILLEGKTSSKRIKRTEPTTFIIKLKDSSVSPDTYIKFLTLEQSRKYRSADYLRTGMFLNGGIKSVSGKNILTFKKLKSDVCIITLTEKLEPGEYAFGFYDGSYPPKPSNCFAFGID